MIAGSPLSATSNRTTIVYSVKHLLPSNVNTGMCKSIGFSCIRIFMNVARNTTEYAFKWQFWYYEIHFFINYYLLTTTAP